MIEYIIVILIIIIYVLIEYNLIVINNNLKIIVKNQIEIYKYIKNYNEFKDMIK